MCSDEKVRVDVGVVYDTALVVPGQRHIYLPGTWDQLPSTDTALEFQQPESWQAAGG